MCLKRLEIQGFKSFGDRIKLELHQGVSVVVGPNGSGKSNISDAVSWCLGEQRASSLRGSRMEDVIFAGSDKRKPVGMAEVTLTLDNAAKLFSLPYDELSVSRRLYRSGESEYLINKVPCRLKDIQALFMDTGLGRGAYSLIGQGKVDEILSSRPEERRSVIEEAAGIVKFRHRKEEALRKLSSAEQDLNRITDIIDELGSRIEPLLIQAEKAKQYNQLQQEAWQLELSLFKRDWDDLNARLKEIAEQLTQTKTELNNEKPIIEEKLEEAKANLLVIENIITEAKERAMRLDTSIEKTRNRLSLINEQITSQAVEKERQENELHESKESEQQLILEIESEKEKLAKLKINLQEQKSTTNEKDLQQLDQEVNEKQDSLENMNTDLIDQLNLVANQRSTMNQAIDRKEQLNQRLKHINRIDEEAKVKENGLVATIDEAQKRVEELIQKKYSLATESSQVEEELKQQNGKLTQTQAKLSAAKEEMVAKHSRLKVLEENLSSHSGFMRPVRELLKASTNRQGSSIGICGAVADLIKVPKGYETAMEAAMGGALQNLVTETSAQAKEAIDYLKKHNLGRATFLPLDSLRPTPPGEWEKKALELKGVIGLAAKLIDVEAKYRSVVELLLGRLVVVDTLDNAIAVARQMQQRLRIVTLSGELFHPGGSLSGGGAVRNTGGMLHTRTERDELSQVVQGIHQKVHELSGSLAEEQRLQEQLVNKSKWLQNDLVTLGLDLQASEMDLNKANEDLSRAKIRSQESQWEISNIQQEFDHWLNIESDATVKLSALEQELENIQANLAETQQELGEARDKKLQLENAVHLDKVRQAELRQELIGLQKIIERLEQEVSSKRIAVATAENSIVQLTHRTKDLAAQEAQLNQELQQFEQEKAEAVENLQTEQRKREASADVVKQLEEQLNALQEQWMKTQQRIHTLELQQARIQTEIELLTSRFEELGIDDPAELEVAPAVNKKQARTTLSELKGRITDLGPVNAGAEEEYLEVTERHNFLLEQKRDLEESRISLQQLIEELNRLMSSQFESAFKIINDNFNTVFQQLFGGGGATMSLTDGNALTCGIEIIARPPGKKNQSLSLLSGGERALTAIALLFAILKYKPSPFCVLDEIEASLDEANVKRFADYLSRTSDEVQFIVISHRKGTMERADSLFGVTMDEAGVTRILSMSLEDFKGNKRLA